MSVENTIKFIKKAHNGQFYGNKPYWTHPVQVAETGKKKFKNEFTHDAYIIALIHDVIEDTKYDENDLKTIGFPDRIIDAVKLCTKDKSLSYAKNIQRIIDSGNRVAMMVKWSDNYVNYTGDKSDWEPSKREHSQNKYKNSMKMIEDKLKEE